MEFSYYYLYLFFLYFKIVWKSMKNKKQWKIKSKIKLEKKKDFRAEFDCTVNALNKKIFL